MALKNPIVTLAVYSRSLRWSLVHGVYIQHSDSSQQQSHVSSLPVAFFVSYILNSWQVLFIYLFITHLSLVKCVAEKIYKEQSTRTLGNVFLKSCHAIQMDSTHWQTWLRHNWGSHMHTYVCENNKREYISSQLSSSDVVPGLFWSQRFCNEHAIPFLTMHVWGPKYFCSFKLISVSINASKNGSQWIWAGLQLLLTQQSC